MIPFDIMDLTEMKPGEPENKTRDPLLAVVQDP